MAREKYDERKKEFKEFVIREERLPRAWEVKFTDNEDMRLWFNQTSKIAEFTDFITEINNILKEYNEEILSDKEKEQEFLDYITYFNHIPQRGESYFSDNDEMYSWYIKYKGTNQRFETMVHNNLPEYHNFNLVEVWPDIKKEFISIIKKMKRIPNHGEIILSNGIDVRVVFDKLETHDPIFAEELLLYLASFKNNPLSINDRVTELLKCITDLGYIPFLQESKFTDGTDMFTWYNRYKTKISNLEEEINIILQKEAPKKKINLYLIHNIKSTGGKFYTICANTGEILDLSEVSSFEEAQKLDKSFVKRGGIILRQNEEIENINFVKRKTKKL